MLIRALRNAHAYLAEAGGSPIGRSQLAFPEAGLENPYHRALTRLAFLTPDIQVLILEGRQPAGLTLQRILREPVPLAWADQRRVFGLAG